jgi:hypothetical protein
LLFLDSDDFLPPPLFLLPWILNFPFKIKTKSIMTRILSIRKYFHAFPFFFQKITMCYSSTSQYYAVLFDPLVAISIFLERRWLVDLAKEPRHCGFSLSVLNLVHYFFFPQRSLENKQISSVG